jgi:putative ABC transport system permease protein
MRVKAINGVDVLLTPSTDSTESDSAPAPPSWAFRREYRSTYRDTAMTSEVLLEGQWWDFSGGSGGGEGSTRVYQVSLEEEIAEELGVGMGDRITWNVQGMPIETRVTSIREVNWAQFQPNFFAVFESGALVDAPQMFVTLTRVDDAGDRGRIQRLLAERFPNVSSIDLGLVQRTLDRIIGSMVLAIRFMALFSLATGAVVLIGAVATSRFQRVRESVLLKTLGGTRNQILRVLLTEYASIGVLSAIVAIGLSTIASWSIMHFVFESGFALPFWELAGLTVALVGITVVVGLWNSTEIFRAPPLAVLRAE